LVALRATPAMARPGGQAACIHAGLPETGLAAEPAAPAIAGAAAGPVAALPIAFRSVALAAIALPAAALVSRARLPFVTAAARTEARHVLARVHLAVGPPGRGILLPRPLVLEPPNDRRGFAARVAAIAAAALPAAPPGDVLVTPWLAHASRIAAVTVIVAMLLRPAAAIILARIRIPVTGIAAAAVIAFVAASKALCHGGTPFLLQIGRRP